ncbi:transposase domain-containing protein [Coraliomargarita parva]
MESAKRHGLEPYAYVRHLLEKLPSSTNWNLHKLTPVALAKASAAA